MIKKFLVLILVNILIMRGSFAQSFFNDEDELVNGFASAIAGQNFTYHSLIPGFRDCMLVRAENGNDFMEWYTDPVKVKTNRKYIAFVWIAAIGSGPGNARMDLTTDQDQRFVFSTDGKPSWQADGSDGSSLSFNSVMTDQNGDHHGYMILRIPSEKISTGKPLMIRVTGSNSNLSSWYMTFRKQVRTGAEIIPLPAVIKSEGRSLQLVEADIFYFGKETRASIYADNKPVATRLLKFGYNSLKIGLPRVARPAKIRLKIVAGDFSTTSTLALNPVKEWNVDLIQHSHTDIGYTRSQTEILAEHIRYIDYALDFCDATDSYPENARFRWTCEVSWPVDEYLKSRPSSQVERLVKRIREGRIEIAGMYLNFDEIPDEQILAASLDALGRIKAKDIPVSLAMQNDVNGIGWCLNDYFTRLGIKYLNMGTHGHRALICFDKPTMFWWESPSGNRMLTFRAEHYMTGNTVFEIQSGDIDNFSYNLLTYLTNLENLGYEYNDIAIQHSGYLTDNSPPSTIASEMIRKWNETFEWPKISTSTAESFFKKMERNHGAEFPVIRGAWPDWWTDGFGAGARETGTVRKASVSLMANTGAFAMASISGIRLPDETFSKIDLADEALIFFTEHTTGYSESVREPFSLPTMEQRAFKESYAWEANRRVASLGEQALGLLQSMFGREKDPSLLVFNTLNWDRSGLATIYIDHQIVPRESTAGIYELNGVRVPVQPLSHRADGTYWAVWLDKIPAFGYKKYLIRALNEERTNNVGTDPGMLENKWYSIAFNMQKGTVKSWIDKELSLNFVDQDSEYGMLEFIHEKLGNRSQMENRKLDDFQRHPLDKVWFESAESGPVFNSVKFAGESETAVAPKGYTIEFRLYNTEKRVEIISTINKKSITDPEGIYIAFPFKLDNSKHFTEVQGGIIETGKDQIPGSSNDWYTVQNFTSLRNQDAQLVMGCSEMPLMQFGAINTGRYKAGAMPQSSHIFSWPMNNYWVTNFNAEQRGGHSWTYYLTTSSDITNGFATKFGWGSRVPFLTRIIPGGGTGNNRIRGSFIEGWPENIILISARPADIDGSVIIHVRETDGRETTLNLINSLTGKTLNITEVDVTHNHAEKSSTDIRPYESKFFILKN
jgi:hypothetical protein